VDSPPHHVICYPILRNTTLSYVSRTLEIFPLIIQHKELQLALV
jgi:hypothetical protein